MAKDCKAARSHHREGLFETSTLIDEKFCSITSHEQIKSTEKGRAKMWIQPQERLQSALPSAPVQPVVLLGTSL